MALHTWGGRASFPNDIKVTISSDGSVLVESSTQDLGTGERTVLAVVVAEVLGLEPKDITVKIGENQYGRSTPSGGSTTCPGTAPPALQAALSARDELFKKIAGRPNANADDLSVEPGKDKGRLIAAPGKEGPLVKREVVMSSKRKSSECHIKLLSLFVSRRPDGQMAIPTRRAYVRCAQQRHESSHLKKSEKGQNAKNST